MATNEHPIAEIIAVGDEMTSGQRLDTNTQWLAQQLNSIGVKVEFHSTVGDDLLRQTDVIRTAMSRANIVVMTGGLGPTKDDLTRQAIADAADVSLEIDEDAIEHIRSIFERNNRRMPDTNRSQAFCPVGGRLIHNEEGTAPGVDYTNGSCRIFALPGVPYEMKLMWDSWVGPEIVSQFGSRKVIQHLALRCFGIGESEAESRMPDLIARERQPRVGITASKSIISFRITAVAESEEECQIQLESTRSYIETTLGDVVFGSENDELGSVTGKMLTENDLSVVLVDFQFGSAAANLLREGIPADAVAQTMPTFLSINNMTPKEWIENDGKDLSTIETTAQLICQRFNCDIGIAIGKLESGEHQEDIGKFDVAIANHRNSKVVAKQCNHTGHSSMRIAKSANQVINFLRLSLNSNSFMD